MSNPHVQFDDDGRLMLPPAGQFAPTVDSHLRQLYSDVGLPLELVEEEEHDALVESRMRRAEQAARGRTVPMEELIELAHAVGLPGHADDGVNPSQIREWARENEPIVTSLGVAMESLEDDDLATPNASGQDDEGEQTPEPAVDDPDHSSNELDGTDVEPKSMDDDNAHLGDGADSAADSAVGG